MWSRFRMFLKRAMRYYRVWIYVTNACLLAASLTYSIVLVWILTDSHLTLMADSVSLLHPSFIYGYFALILQSGVIQVIGCLGAVRMNEKFLNIYWNLLVALILGDAIVGFVWIYRYNLLMGGLKSDLKSRLNMYYGFDVDFTEIWDRFQVDHDCCGVDSPLDYNSTIWLDRRHQHFPHYKQVVPRSCCRSSSASFGLSTSSESPPPHYLLTTTSSIPGSIWSTTSGSSICIESYSPELIFVYGCYRHVQSWVMSRMDMLTVFGFCVLSFLKVCFAFILRYELKEMIQKIQVLKGAAEEPTATSGQVHELEAYLPRPSLQETSLTGNTVATGILSDSRRRLTRSSHGLVEPPPPPPTMTSAKKKDIIPSDLKVTAMTSAAKKGSSCRGEGSIV